MNNNKIIIIDGNSLINRAYYALPHLMTKEGLYTNAIYGFINMLNKINSEYDPGYIVVAFDKKAPTFRHLEYTEYKAGRKKMPPELAQQLPLLKEVLDAMRIKMLELDGFEADDLIGTVVKRGEEAGLEPIVISGDKDELQLASDVTRIIITKKGISEFETYDRQAMHDKYGISPEQFIDLKGLMGDSSDNIPGIPGIGEKTGLSLLHEYGSIQNLIENADTIKSEKLRNKIQENAHLAVMSRRLSEINTNVPVDIDFNEFLLEQPDSEKLVKLYNRFEFYSLIAKIKTETPVNRQDCSEIHSKLVSLKDDLEEFKLDLQKSSDIIIKVFSDNNHKDDPLIFGLSALIKEHCYFFQINEVRAKEIAGIFSDYKVEISGHNLKTDLYALLSAGFESFNTSFDTAIAQYLLEPERSNYNLRSLSLEYLNEEIPDEAEFVKENSQIDFFARDEKKYEEFGLKWCVAVRRIMETQTARIEAEGLSDLYQEVELPLVEILAFMENYGFSIDKKELTKTGKAISEKIEDISNKIYELAGETFNINSPKQLGPILFEKLKLPAGKKTKTGYSTGADVLEKLSDAHEIIPLILEFRMLTKLNGTYIEGLLPLINPADGKIHAHFNQTVTATGRISCTEPNLQNIPIKQELGRELRKAFIPESEDYVLMGADYSQIELRVLAHLSKDESLIEAFKKGEDIHRLTASKVFNIPEDEVTSLQRSRAKAVNFGVVYGMSDYGLSESLNIPKKEAAKYIDEYFKKYGTVKQFMDGLIEQCKKDGYVTTIRNRKRQIPEIHSHNFMVRSLGERLAMNTPIQGSAADIIKIAMINVFRGLKKENLKSTLILQVHDELVIQVYKDELERVQKILVENMMNAVKLEVPLDVDVHAGSSWYELK